MKFNLLRKLSVSKKAGVFAFMLFLPAAYFFAQEEDPIVKAYLDLEENGKTQEEKERFKYTKEKIYPEPKRPKKPDSSKIEKIILGDEKKSTDEYVEKCNATFKYGLEAEISSLLDELTKNEDLRFVDPIYDLFFVTKDVKVKNKIISYFTKLKDPCLEDFACEVINDPYDVKKDTVDAVFKYAAEIECYSAVPGLIDLIDKEEEEYFNIALSTLGSIGGTEEALFLTDFLDRDDLTVPQRQSLMRVLGKIKAVETWDRLVEIARDEDENSFVRMYAAEAIGAMEKPESEEILIELFESDDPNFRIYVIKGISYFNDEKADSIILQGLRDSQYKVRLEAVEAVEKRNLKEAVPYLVYRCKDKDEQKQVKEKAYKVIAKLNEKEGNEYLISIIKDKKVADSTKGKVVACLLEENHAGTEEIIALARDALKDDLKKNLRYAVGKEFAKYGRPEFESICRDYLESKDVATQGTGLDIWAKGRYAGLRSFVESLAKEADDAENKDSASPKKKVNANAKKAKRVLEQVDSLTGYTATASTEENSAVDAVSSAAPEKNETVTTDNSNTK